MFDGIENVQPDQRRGWTALVSFTLQAAAVAAALTIPLLYPSGLSDAFAHRRIFVPISGPVGETPQGNPHPSNGGGVSLTLRPIYVNQRPATHFHSPSVDPGPVGPPVIDFGPGPMSAVPGPIVGIPQPPIAHLAAVAPPRVSRPMQGYLIHRVEPIYPSIAKIAGVQGAVLIKALISTEGKIEQAQVVSGSPWLSKAALDAIQQWRYRPYYLNDKPVEVETEITVTFYLNR